MSSNVATRAAFDRLACEVRLTSLQGRVIAFHHLALETPISRHLTRWVHSIDGLVTARTDESIIGSKVPSGGEVGLRAPRPTAPTREVAKTDAVYQSRTIGGSFSRHNCALRAFRHEHNKSRRALSLVRQRKAASLLVLHVVSVFLAPSLARPERRKDSRAPDGALTKWETQLLHCTVTPQIV